MYKSSIIMYPIVFDCIRLYHMGCHHVKSCQDGTDLAYFLQLQTRTTCIGLLECTCRFSFHCHPLRGLAHCVCVCVVGVSPRKIQASCVCTVTKSEWRVFFGLPDSPSLSLSIFFLMPALLICLEKFQPCLAGRWMGITLPARRTWV